MKYSKNQIIWGLSSSIFLIIFTTLTPITLFFQYGIIISMAEGFICVLLIAFVLLNISSLQELSNIDKKEESKSLKSILVPFLSFIIFSFFIYNVLDSKINSKIQNEGIFTQAKFINGEQIIKKSLRRTNTSYNISLVYKDSIANKDVYAKTDINSDVFNKVYKGQTIQIKYLPKYTSIFKIMIGDKNIKKFKNISNRYINLYDIVKLLSLKNEEAKIEYLKSISQGWNKTTDGNGLMFSNDLKKEIIAIAKNGKIYLESSNLNNFIPKKEIIKTTQIKTEKEKNVVTEKTTLYETDSLMITKVYRVVLKLPKTETETETENYLLIEKKK